MDALTHLLVGRLLALPLGGPLAVLATVFAVLPDIDTVTWAFPRLRRYLQHRGLTHSLLFGAVASVAAGALFAFAGWAPFWLAALVALVAFLSHLLLDVLNWGCALLWPWRRGRVEYTVHHGFRRSIPLAAGGLVLLEGTRLLAPALHAPVGALLALVIVGHFALRVARRVLAGAREADADAAVRG